MGHVSGDRHVPRASALPRNMARMHDMRLSLSAWVMLMLLRTFKAAEGMLRVQDSHTFYLQ